jgi:hypothetical protein
VKRHLAVLALVAVTVVPATALAASRQKHSHKLDTTLTGADLYNVGSVFTTAALATDPAIGRGAAIVTVDVTSPSTITGTVYYPAGSLTIKGSIAIGTPDANGNASTTGSGRITAGTGKYHGATGSMTFTGSQDANGHYKVGVTGTVKY